MLLLQPLQPLELLPPTEKRLRLLSHGRVVARVPPPQFLGLPTLSQLLANVLVQGLQHHKTWLSPHPIHRSQETLLDERLHCLQHVLLTFGVTDRPDGFQSTSTYEHSKPHEQSLLSCPQQFVTPVYRAPERPLPLGQVPCSACEQLEPTLQTREHRLGRKHPHPGCGQLDRERETIQPAADLRHGAGGVSIEHHVGSRRARPVQEELERRRVLEHLDRGRRFGQRQGGDPVLVLAADAQGRPASCQHNEARGGLKQGENSLSRGEQVLTVVQQ